MLVDRRIKSAKEFCDAPRDGCAVAPSLHNGRGRAPPGLHHDLGCRLLAVAVCGGLLLSTPVGRQALVDERVRVIEALGGRVDDAAYAALQAQSAAGWCI